MSDEAPHGWSYQVEQVRPEQSSDRWPLWIWVIHNRPELIEPGAPIDPVDPVTGRPHGLQAVIVKRWPSTEPGLPVEIHEKPARRRKGKGNKNAPRTK